jgi:hypothetical protein
MAEIKQAAAGVARDSDTLLVCLCAAWCDTCDAYRATLERVLPQFPNACVVWLDIEDQEDLLGPVEVENFPTVLIARGEQVRFFGTITPQPETLARLLRANWADDAGAAAVGADVQSLLRRLRGS